MKRRCMSRAPATGAAALLLLLSSTTSHAGQFGRPRSFTTAFLDDPRLQLLDLRGGAQKGDRSKSKPKSKSISADSWHPFPDLARDRDYRDALRAKRSRSQSRSMSYKNIAKIQSALHSVEPTDQPRVARAYMCRTSAERFRSGSPRVGLLLGTVQRERVKPRGKRRSRTSLSSQTEDTEYCTAIKVQAVWEPPNQKEVESGHYPHSASEMLTANPRVLAVAEELGLRPVGWIFGYLPETRPSATKSNPKDEDGENSLPIVALDVFTGAKLQMENMRHHGEGNAVEFVTLAMDATSGATEAFQLSDVCVQMVSEDMLAIKSDVSDATTRKEKVQVRQKRGYDRYVPTKHEVLVDGQETTLLDSVLCLINTALLSHEGSFVSKVSGTSSPVKKKSGALTSKTKKAIVRAIKESGADDNDLLQTLCDFQILLALDQLVSASDSAALCQLVRKWARGQKKGTTVPDDLKTRIRGVLET